MDTIGDRGSLEDFSRHNDSLHITHFPVNYYVYIKRISVLISESILCLSLVVFYEARGEPVKAQFGTLEVVHNRSKHPDYPNTYCGVVKQKGQFSWYKGSNSLKPPKHEKEAWDESVKVARNFYTNKTNYTKGSLYFNHKKLGVRFNKTLKVKIGQHVFF